MNTATRGYKLMQGHYSMTGKEIQMVETIIKWSLKDIFKADAQKCYEEIQQIGEEVTPLQVLDRAKDKSSELHKCFDWNNSVAADKWRLYQARSVLNHLIVVKRGCTVDVNAG